MAKLTMFISYVSEDSGISDSLNNAIRNAFGDKITIFLDKVSIQQGENIHDTISANLAKADILVVVSTGTDRPSHDWAGWELGYFDASHQIKNEARPLWGRVVIFNAPNASVRPHAAEKYIPMDLEIRTLDLSQQEYDASLKISCQDPVLLWFGELYAAINNELLSDNQEMLDKYERIIGNLKKKIFAEYKRRPKSVVRPQKQIIIRYDANAVEYPGPTLPASATIAFRGIVTSIFGLFGVDETKEISWCRFSEQVSTKQFGKFWTSTLERLLASASSSGGALDFDNGHIMASHDYLHIYRLILTSFTTSYNNMIEASIYLVEIYKRKDFGKRSTSKLLKGLQIICRFRFLFLEMPSEFYYFNVEMGENHLGDVADRLVAELDLLTSDIIEAELNLPSEWRDFVNENTIREMTACWNPLRDRLLQQCSSAITINDLEGMRTLRAAMTKTLLAIKTEVGPFNTMLLKGIASKLTEVADGT